MIEVTQSARDAAADLLGGACPDGVREGKHDSLSVVQAIAAAEQRGMIAARDAAVKVAQGMVCYGEEDGSAEYDTACRMIAQAIATMNIERTTDNA